MCTDENDESVPTVRLHAGTKILKAKLPSSSNRPDLTLIGRSWAADSTAFCVPELNVGFDAGFVVSEKRLSHFLISHVHNDHIHMLTHLKSRTKPPQFVVPRESIPLCEGYLEAAQQLTSHLSPEDYSKIQWQQTHTYTGVSAGESIVLDQKRGLHVNILHCEHTIPCVGYRLSLVKDKLKPEYAQLSGREIGQLRKRGVAVTERIRTSLLTFLGDTDISIFENPNTVGDSPLVIVECSFLDPEEKSRASATKHVHWLDLEPHVRSHPDTLFILIHFSHRYSPEYVREFFANKDILPTNILPWVQPASCDDLPECLIHS